MVQHRSSSPSPRARRRRGAEDLDRHAAHQDVTEAWKRYSQELFTQCLKWLNGNRANAEEAFGRAALRIFSKFGTYSKELGELRPWMLRLTYSACMDLHRESRRRREESLDVMLTLRSPTASTPPPASQEDPEQSLLEKESLEVLGDAIEVLPERLRRTVMSYLSSDSYRETAKDLATTEATVRKRMQEARTFLRQVIGDHYSGLALVPAEQAPGARRAPRRQRSRDASGGPPPPLRASAVRRLTARLPSGAESEEAVSLFHVPERPGEWQRRDLERYVSLHPGGWKRALVLGRLLWLEGQTLRAIPCFEHVVRKQPHRIDVWLELANVRRLQEGPEAAVAVYEQALEAVRTQAGGHLLRGLLLRCLRREAEAEASLHEARREMPGCAAPLVALGKVLEGTGRPGEAAAIFEAAAAADPLDVAALASGAESLRLAGRSGQVAKRLLRALEIDPGNEDAGVRWLQARCRATGGWFPPDSVEQSSLERFRQQAGVRADATRALAFWHVCQGRCEAAERLLKALVQLRPHLIQGWVEYAGFLDWSGRGKEAVRAIEQVRSLAPRCRLLHLLACRYAVRAGLRLEAFRAIAELQRLYGSTWEVDATVAWTLARLGSDRQRAAELSRRAVAHQPGLPAAWLDHGRLLAFLGSAGEAVEALETGWKLIPEDDGFELAAPAALALAALHQELGDAERARSWAHRSLSGCAAQEEIDPVTARVWRSRAAQLLAGDERESQDVEPLPRWAAREAAAAGGPWMLFAERRWR